MHGYVVQSRIGTFAYTTLQLEFSVYSGKKKSCKKKYVKNLKLINKVKKKAVVSALGYERSEPGFRIPATGVRFFFHASKIEEKEQYPSSGIYSQSYNYSG